MRKMQRAIVRLPSRIEELCKEQDITLNGLGYLFGVSASTIMGIFYKHSKNPGGATFKKLCDGFIITLAQFFDTEAFNSYIGFNSLPLGAGV